MGLIYSIQGNSLFKRYTHHAHNNNVNIGGERRPITAFTRQSSANMRRYLRCCRADYSFIGTLTYPEVFPSNGREAKDHLKRFIRWYLRNAKREARFDEEDKVSFFWFLEFQKRGAPHFHYFCTHGFGKGIADLREKIANQWFTIVGSGDEKHLSAGTQFDRMRSGRGGCISYATKYALKAEQKTVPTDFDQVGRFWGVSGDRMTVAADIWLNNKALMNREIHYQVKKFERTIKQGVPYVNVHPRFDSHGELRSLYAANDVSARWVRRQLRKLEEELIKQQLFAVWDEEPWDITQDEDF